MPSVDRYWRIAWVAGYLALALTAGSIALYLLTLFISMGSQWPLPWVIQNAGWIFLFCTIAAAMLFPFAEKARARQRLRQRVVAGDTGALPPANVEMIPTDTGDEGEGVTEGEVALFWRQRPNPNYFLVIFMIFGLALVASIFGVLFLSTDFPTIPWWLIVIFIWVMGIVAWLQRYDDAAGIIATSEGLLSLRADRQVAFIPWNEARLFEIWRQGSDAQPRYGYALWSARARIEWPDFTVENAPVLVDADADETYWRLWLLIQTVTTRTQLTMRTSAPNLATDSAPLETVQRQTLSQTFAFLALIAFFVIPTIVAALDAILAPLTDSLLLNIAFAALCVFWAIVFSGAAIVVLRDALRPASIGEALLDSMTRLPALEHVTLPLRLRQPYFWRLKGSGALIALLTVGATVAYLRSISEFPGSSGSGLSWIAMRASVQIIGFCVCLVSVALAALALLLPRWRVVADEQALSWRAGFTIQRLTWDEISTLNIIVKRGKVVAYRALDSGLTKVEWSATANWTGPAPDLTLANSDVTPAALFATAVAQRAGVTPRVAVDE